MAERELLVRIIGDDRDLQRALGRTERAVENVDRRTQRLGRNVAGAFAAVGITVGLSETFDLMQKSIGAASDLNEEIAKSGQVFGEASGEVQEWAKTTADSLGISRTEALRATGTFGNLFSAIGTAPREAASMSRALVQLAADLASFNNASPEDVLLAIRSGLVGEAEPLRRYGVLLSEARVQQEALAASGKDNVKELTNQEKALARYQIILQDTATAQGDFARTQGSLANQTRILDANMADLASTMGGLLLPAALNLTKQTNRLFTLFGEEHEIQLDASGAEEEILRLQARIESLGRGAVGLRAELQKTIDTLSKIATPGPDDRDGPRGPGAIDVSNAQVDARNAEQAAAEAKRAAARRQKAFDEFIKGQGLKLDQAALTRNLQDDLAVLRAIEQAVLRRIAEEGRTFKLVEQLARVRLEIQNTTEQAAADAQDAGEAAFEATIDALDLNLEIARATQSLEDDQAALRALERAILARIAAEGQNTDLMRQLFNVREEQRRVAEQLAEQRRERRQGRQFEALGLTEEGERPTPGVGALSRRLENLRDQIKGTVLDTEKTRRELDRIADVLSGKFGAVGKTVREAILQMFNDITGALEGGSKSGSGSGQITPGGIRPLERLIAGAKLTEEQIAVIQRNMMRRRSGRPVNAFGFDLDGPSSRAISGFPGMGDFSPIINVTVEIDGKKVTGAVTKELQKTGKRRTNRRGGAGAGRGAIL